MRHMTSIRTQNPKKITGEKILMTDVRETAAGGCYFFALFAANRLLPAKGVYFFVI